MAKTSNMAKTNNMAQINNMAQTNNMAKVKDLAQIMAQTNMASMVAIIDNILARLLDNSRLDRISLTPALYVVKKATGEMTAPP